MISMFPPFVLPVLSSVEGRYSKDARHFPASCGGRKMNYPVASCGVSNEKHFEENCRVGGGAKRRYPPRKTMGIAESILSTAEGLNPSYA